MITMMVGIPGSGKSTWAKIHRPNAIIISTDDIRAKLWGDASIQKNSDKVFAVAFKEIREAIAQGFDVVFDACNVSKRDRKRAFAQFPKDVEVEAVVINVSKEKAMVQNTMRSRYVPPVAIAAMAKRFAMPRLEEGFFQIIEINS